MKEYKTICFSCDFELEVIKNSYWFKLPHLRKIKIIINNLLNQKTMKKHILTLSSAFLLLLLFQININAQTYISGSGQEKFVNTLPDPAVIDATNGGNYNIFMAQTSQHLGIYDGTTSLETDVWGYGTNPNNVTYPGPTFHAKENEQITVKWKNQLPYSHLLDVDVSLHWANPPSGIATVAHLHGGHTESASDGLPEAWFTQNFQHKGPYWVKKKYKYDNDQEAATLWYHDHALGITRLNVYAGLAGFYLLRDDNELDMIDNNVLPSGDYEREIVIQDRLFVHQGGKAQLYFPSEGEAEEEDCPVEEPEDVPYPSVVAEFFPENTEDLFIIVNGAAWPKLDVEPRKYRFRFLNGSDSRFYVLKLENTTNGGYKPFMQIGSDNGFLPYPVTMNEFLISPGERFDMIFDFTGMAGKTFTLKNFGPDEPFKGIPQDEADPSTTGLIMRFNVNQDLSNVPNASVNVNTSLRPPIPTLYPNGPTRKLVLFEGRDEFCRLRPMLGTVDDGSLLWDETITENPQINKTEIWEIYNATEDAHPIHLHLVSFQIMNRQGFTGEADYDFGDIDPTGIPRLKLTPVVGGPTFTPLANEQGWKDTGVVPPGQVMRVIAKFDKEGRYVWHCHILSHEDHEMMRPFYVGNIPPNYFPITDGGFDTMEEENLLPDNQGAPVVLTQNKPNPFSDITEIGYNMSDDADISIWVTDMNGKVIKTLVNGYQNAGLNYVTWDGTDQSGNELPNGIYTCMLRSDTGLQAIKMMILR
jgi:spore coat protein A